MYIMYVSGMLKVVRRNKKKIIAKFECYSIYVRGLLVTSSIIFIAKAVQFCE